MRQQKVNQSKQRTATPQDTPLSQAFDLVDLRQLLADYYPELPISLHKVKQRIPALWRGGTNPNVALDARGMYDFKTGESYTAWTFLTQVQGLSKGDAAKELLYRAGLEDTKPQRRVAVTPKRIDPVRLSAQQRKRAARLADKLARAHTLHGSGPRTGESGYLKRKRVDDVKTHQVQDGLVYGENGYGGFIQLPLMTVQGTVTGFQRIFDTKALPGERDKDFIGKKEGSFVALVPTELGAIPLETQALAARLRQGYSLHLCEGFATGLTLCKARPRGIVLVALDAGNLKVVAGRFREHYGYFAKRPWYRLRRTPLRLTLWADNDQFTEGNPGLTKARETAKAYRCKVLYPKFRRKHLAGKPTDFNDLYVLEGRRALP